jgi:hypothetical protein
MFLALLTEQSPHLVHHVFEHETPSSECIFLAGAERAPMAATALALALPAPEQVDPVPSPPHTSLCPRGARAPADSRAPPPLVS